MQSSRLFDTHDRARVADRLKDAGIPSPFAYIRGLNAEYDRGVRIASLVQDRPAAEDFSVAVRAEDGERWVFLEKLSWDSDFFSCGIARFEALVDAEPGTSVADPVQDRAALDAALRLAAEGGIDYVFGTIDATDLRALRMLSLAGFELIEVRCHYHMMLKEPAARYPVRLAGPADVPSLARAARVMVNPYDRFHADLAIPAADADRMMERWVEASILEGFADATIVPDVERPEAFCTAKYHRQHWKGWGLRLAQPILSAVAPVHRGWYVKIISELNEHLRSVGAEHSCLVTQITNNAVIRCWEKLGYQFGKGEYVFRKLLTADGGVAS